MLREYRVVVVQRQSNDPQVATKGHGEEDKSFTQSMFKVPSTPRAAPVVDVNWMGSQVKEHHHQSHRQIVKTTAAASTTKTCEVRNTSSGESIGWRPKEQRSINIVEEIRISLGWIPSGKLCCDCGIQNIPLNTVQLAEKFPVCPLPGERTLFNLSDESEFC